MGGWTDTVAFSIGESLKRARSASACCDADAADDLGDVKDEIEQAIKHLEVAENYAASALAGETRKCSDCGSHDPATCGYPFPHRHGTFDMHAGAKRPCCDNSFHDREAAA